jgi:hypothetical protein
VNEHTVEIINICHSLPEDRLAQLADFARYLLAQHVDRTWERFLASTQRRPRLEHFLRRSALESDEPLDRERL